MTVSECYKRCIRELSHCYGTHEASAITREVFLSIGNLEPVDIALKGPEPLSTFLEREIVNALIRIKAGEPVQYVTGNAWFHGHRLKVGPGVLIPRPETSQLVDIIEKDWRSRSDLHIIDLCCGSGAIAIALSRALPFSIVTGVDLSEEALEYARINSSDLKCSVKLVNCDVLVPALLPSGKYDIIVSNPPYIPLLETDEIELNVIKYEPHSALFVPDEDPLVFYRNIAEWATTHITEGGKVYFEINPHFVGDMKRMMVQQGFSNVESMKDFYNCERFIIASL